MSGWTRSLLDRLRERRQEEAKALTTDPVRLTSAVGQPRANYRKPPPDDVRYTLFDRTNPVAAIFDAVAWRNNLSHSDLAKLVGVDRSHISHIRAQRRVPTRELVLRMVELWPMTPLEAVELCEHFQVIPPGHRLALDSKQVSKARQELRGRSRRRETTA